MNEDKNSKIKGTLIMLAIAAILIVVFVAGCQHYMVWSSFEDAYYSAFDLHDGEAPNGIKYECVLEGEKYEAYVKYEDDFSTVTVGTTEAAKRKAEDIEKYDLPFEKDELQAHNEGIEEANALLEELLQEKDARGIDTRLRDFFGSRGGTVKIVEQVGDPLPEE